MNTKLRQAFRSLGTAITKLTAGPVTDEDIPDASGQCRHYERKLAEWRQGLTSELTAGVHVGTDYQIRVPNQSHRSYNPQAIIADVAHTCGLTPISAILELRQEGAIRLDFVWTQLEKFFQTRGIDMRITNGRELNEDDMTLDGSHVGCYWTAGTPAVEVAGKQPFQRKAKP